MTAGRPSNGRRSVRRWSSTRPMISTPRRWCLATSGDYFTDCDYPTRVSTYKLAEGTDIENEVTVLQGEEEGPTIYIVAGVHGDEIAGWMTGNLVKKIGIRAGTVHILSPANRWGAEADPRVRYVTEQRI